MDHRPVLSVPANLWSSIAFGLGDGACWLWVGPTNDQGYGIIRDEGFVHRLVWAFFRGDPGELCVCHACDNPSCCRPDHLFLGTRGENNRDCLTKGRTVFGESGERSHAHRITAEEVVYIRTMRSQGEPVASLAAQFGVSGTAISYICRGKNWKSAGGPLTFSPPNGASRSKKAVRVPRHRKEVAHA